jgi:hypothetical protein
MYIVIKNRNKKLGSSGVIAHTSGFDKSTVGYIEFSRRLTNFIEKTEEHEVRAATPGGYYTGLWCRDSSYIPKDGFLSGRIQEVLDKILVIWSHPIEPRNNDRIYLW